MLAPVSSIHFFRWSILLIGFAFTLSGHSSAAEARATNDFHRPLEERQPLRVGIRPELFAQPAKQNPFAWHGFAKDLLEAVGRVMQLQLQYIPIPQTELRQALENGEIDIQLTVARTVGSEQYSDFTASFLTLRGTVFVRKSLLPVDNLTQLSGRTFADFGDQSVGAIFLQDHQLQAQRITITSLTEGLQLVDSGKCDAIYASNLNALSEISNLGLRNVAMLDLPIKNNAIQHAFAVRKGDTQLLAQLNEGLAILRSTGEFTTIHDAWLDPAVAATPLFSRQQVLQTALAGLTLALIASLAGFFRQRHLRKRITQQTHALIVQKTELADQQVHLQALYDHIPMAMCVVDLTSTGPLLLSVNRHAETLFEQPAQQLIGRQLREITPRTESLALLAELIQQGFSSPNLLREEHRLSSLNKRYIFTLVPMPSTEHGHPRLCVLAEDITERRNLDDEIAQSRKLRAIGELVGGIAHEFNNLLTPIMLKVGEIQMDWAHEASLMTDTRLIADAVQRSAELTQRLLTFGRKTDHRLESVHLGALINNCLALLRLTLDRRILLEQAVPSDLPPLQFNATDINQIILNLIINARDTLLDKLITHPPDWTPAIRIEVRHLPAAATTTSTHRPIIGWQQLRISDNGMGMSPEIRERIFEPFFTTKEVGKGTGLGLATVWHLVTEVSGRIEVESQPGQGTTFVITLPMFPAAAPTSAPIIPPPAEHRPACIFLAEDDPLVAKTVLITLRRAGHIVTHLADGTHAWDHLKTNLDQYDLLLLDVNMPGLDGIELTQRIRADGRYTGRILIASGRLDTSDLAKLAQLKIDAILNKPFGGAELLEAIRNSLQVPR